MQAPDVVRAVGAAMEVASELDFAAAEARVLHDSNKLTLRLLPCDVVARVAFAGLEDFDAELEIGRRLAEVDGPVARLEPRVEPRVYERHGLALTFWTHYEQARQELSPTDYAEALERCMRVWRASMSLCLTSRTESRKLNNWLRTRAEHQGSTTRNASF